MTILNEVALSKNEKCPRILLNQAFTSMHNWQMHKVTQSTSRPRILIGTGLFFYSKFGSRLTSAGYDVSDISSPDELYNRCPDYHVVIFDLNNPDLGGIETLRQLRSIYEGKIIVFAGHTQKNLLDISKEIGADKISINSEMAKDLEGIVNQVLQY
jgi:CheY-like chemotaxis protein